MRAETNRLFNTNKELYKQWGFSWKGARPYKSSATEIIATIEKGGWAHYDIDEDDTSIKYTFYTANDMW